MRADELQVAGSFDGRHGTRMGVTTVFPTAQAMEQLIAMGMEEGVAAAMGQIDGLLTTESV